MRVHVLQHVAFEGLGSIKHWLDSKQASITYTKYFEPTFNLPDLDSVDFIIALGGSMSVNDEGQFPWLAAEKQFIAEAVNKNKTLLGICLGCQLIASALGSNVYPGDEQEIGWFPVYAQKKSHTALAFPNSFEVFHWHGETFDLPPEATLLASSAAYRNQAFQIGHSILGLQFHLESTPESVAAIISHCRLELLPQRFIQTEQQLRSVQAEKYHGINVFMNQLLEYLIAHAYSS
jgi:GMP synthase-like glutamine amidotransferase